MKKNSNYCVDLKTFMQKDALLVEGQSYNGILTRDAEDQYIFEETIRKGRAPRNPKLFDGDYISLVRMQNGKYQCHLKTFDPCGSGDANKLAFKVYSEMIHAFKRFD
ncbi:MAG: hypothetical protein MJZ69_08295 [Bacteroidaceae bacterium]|nr:hypothetical protein [Bacteroidaceae bacterium]